MLTRGGDEIAAILSSERLSISPFRRSMARSQFPCDGTARRALAGHVDEKSQIQALDRTQPLLPLRRGQVERRTHDDVRHGTATLFAALDIASGEVTGRCYARHRHQEFLRFLELINIRYPGFELHLVLDNYRTHKLPEVRDWLAHHQRFHLHFTPTSAS